MKQIVKRTWTGLILGNFLAGLFVVLPIALTVGVLAWMGNLLRGWFGPDTPAGRVIQGLGGSAVDSERIEMAVGWALVLAGIWMLGVIFRAAAKHKLEEAFHGLLGRVPLVNRIYKPIAQVVGLLKGGADNDLKSMNVVYCAFGAERGGGFLGLAPTEETYLFGERECRLVYVPTSPVPMSGGLVFVPIDAVQNVEMSVDDMMKVYFSLGVLAAQTIPRQYKKTG
jgi:uncharacterized membrane protein